MQSLTEQYRPRRLAEIVGQPTATSQLSEFVRNPHSCAILLSGKPGLGKSAASECVANELGCIVAEEDFGGFFRIPPGSQSVKIVKEITNRLWNIPFHGSGWKILICEECEQCSGEADTVWRHFLEHMPAKCVCIFSTNEPEKLTQQFRERCNLWIEFETGYNGTTLCAANGLINRIWTAERPGEPCPIASDLPGALLPKEQISFRRVVQAVQRRLLDPSPFAPEVAPPTFFAAPITRPTAKTLASDKPKTEPKPYYQLTEAEKRAVDAARYADLDARIRRGSPVMA
jgi:hypothetical protein